MSSNRISRRRFLSNSSRAIGTILTACAMPLCMGTETAQKKGSGMQFGLVTYQWGKDWDLPTLIKNCETASCPGVELRTTHAHEVEPNLDKQQRKNVKKRFADSAVKLAGLGSNERFDDPDPEVLTKAIETTKAFIQLSHDVGSSGVKVKPDSFHEGTPKEKTIEQIGNSLNTLGKFASDYGQQVRLEVHGQCAELPTIKAIMDIASNPNVAVCWNSNAQDLQGEGLEYNFNLVKNRFGATAHVRELDSKGYPFEKLIELFVKMDYKGWILLEASSTPEDRIKALARQAELFRQMVAAAQAANSK